VLVNNKTMSVNSRSTKNFVKHRPLGVWILTLYTIFMNGFFPLFEDPYLLLIGDSAFINPDQAPQIIFGGIVNVFFVIVSFLAWKGMKIGRTAIWVLVTIYYESIAFFILLPKTVKLPILRFASAWEQQLWFILIPVLYIWYFNKRSTKEFYKKS
jgi:hypothetical protein